MINKLYLAASMSLIMSLSSNSWSTEMESEVGSSDRAIGTEFFLSDDSEDFQTAKLSAEFLPKYQHADNYMGVRTSLYQYKAQDWKETGEKISFIARNIDTATANGWSLDAGLFHQNQHTLFTLDGSYRTDLAKHTAVEVFANRDWVETKPALESGVHFTMLGAAIDQQLGDHVTLVGLAGTQFFSDDNRRDHGRVKVIYQPMLDLGLTLQARYRMFQSEQKQDVATYFNPEDYEEGMLAIGWRKRIAGWTTGATVGFGRERINHDHSQGTRLFELNVQSPVKGSQFLRLNAGYNRSASFYGPDYNYRYLRGEWIYRF